MISPSITKSYTMIADLTADLVYVRLQTDSDALEAAYLPKTLDIWADRFKTYAAGGQPKDLALTDGARKSSRRGRVTSIPLSFMKGRCGCRLRP